MTSYFINLIASVAFICRMVHWVGYGVQCKMGDFSAQIRHSNHSYQKRHQI